MATIRLDHGSVGKSQMKKFTSIILILIALVSCNEDDPSNDGCPNGSCDYEVLTNSQVIFTNIQNEGIFTDITAGNKLVFRRTFIYADAKDIIDDELTEILLFEVDPSVSEFTWTNEELAEHTVLFGRFCYCAFFGYQQITEGTISGTKLTGGVWRITADINIGDAVSPAKFTALFN